LSNNFVLNPSRILNDVMKTGQLAAAAERREKSTLSRFPRQRITAGAPACQPDFRIARFSHRQRFRLGPAPSDIAGEFDVL
jgi:hypothetical protein